MAAETERPQREKRMEIRELNFLLEYSPATSPIRSDDHAVQVHADQENMKTNHHQGKSGNLRQKRNRGKAYWKIDQLKKEKDSYKTLWETNRKACQGLRKKYEKTKRKSTIRIKQKKSKGYQAKNQKKIVKDTNILKKIYNRTGHSVSWNIDMRRRIRHFLEEDINSTQGPGKKDTITRRKKKMRKRYLDNTILNLYKSLTERYPVIKVTYVSFCRLRPFGILHKKVDARETCLCKLHRNVKLRTETIFRMKFVDSPNPNTLMEKIV